MEIKEAKDQFRNFRGKEFREHQEEAIRFALESKKKFVVLCMPTGNGKSLIGMVAGKISGGCTYLVHSKVLQVQLQNDFPEAPILWGRGNYECLDSGGKRTCDMCIYSDNYKCENKKGDCLYVKAKNIALNSSIKILNYDYWIHETNYVGQFSGESLVIVDEADSLEDLMASFIGLEFTDSMIKRLRIKPPEYTTTSSIYSIDSWKLWAKESQKSVGYVIGGLKKKIKNMEEADPGVVREIEKLTGVYRKLDMFSLTVDDTWIYEAKEYNGRKTMSFKPIWITQELANRFVWDHGDKFVLMSATFPPLPVLSKTIGVPLGEIDYREFPSTFPVANREVKLEPVANLVFKDMKWELPRAVRRVEEILEIYPDQKGLIHCVSYAVSDAIMKIKSGRLICHNGANKLATLDFFKRAKEPFVLVSPSSERGLSLPEDECRFIIWVKAPYLNLQDKLVSARIYGSKVGNLWYKSDMLLSVIQGCGRGVRSKEDSCITHILDKQIINGINDNVRLLPKWWVDALW